VCGVIGLWTRREAGTRLVEGLLALQHRGQDSAGVLTSDGTFHLKKGNGTVGSVFNDKNLARLTGTAGIGQVRYPTIGPGSVEDAQPFYVGHPFGIAMVHNGNVTNYADLRRELMCRDFRQLNSYSDVEPILNVFAEELDRTNLNRFSPTSVFKAVRGVSGRVHGAYSVVALIHGRGLLAFRDRFGIRPLVFAAGGNEFAFASESVAFDLLGFRRFSDVKAGEAVFVDCRGKVHRKQVMPGTPRPCIFEYVYFARPDSVMDDIGIYEARLRLGERLAVEVARQGVRPDVVVPVPDTARPAANSLATALGIELREGLIKNRYVARTFIMHGQERRALSVRQKLNPVKSQVRDKDVLLVDDSIVRGTTSREIVQMVREAGARKVFLAITAPPLRCPCIYGIDMMTRGEFVAKGRTVEQIRGFVGADALVYQTYDGLVEAVAGHGPSSLAPRSFCTACFDGNYPTRTTRRYLAQMERERQRWLQ
jgi:amidophosphoribosyltransferase